MITTRREILRTAVGVGSLAATQPLGGAWAAVELTATPRQTMGPFYPAIRPLDADADLTVIRGRPGRAEGQVIHLTGRVLDRQGRPVRGAKIELWQANARGRYAHSADVNPAPLDPNFQGFAVQSTDDDGQYRFKTIKPTAYPINPMNPHAVRPPHIHFDVASQDMRLVTQMYFPGEAQNDADVIYGALSAEERQAVTASVLPPTLDLEPASLLLHWDIVLVSD